MNHFDRLLTIINKLNRSLDSSIRKDQRYATYQGYYRLEIQFYSPDLPKHRIKSLLNLPIDSLILSIGVRSHGRTLFADEYFFSQEIDSSKHIIDLILNSVQSLTAKEGRFFIKILENELLKHSDERNALVGVYNLIIQELQFISNKETKPSELKYYER